MSDITSVHPALRSPAASANHAARRAGPSPTSDAAPRATAAASPARPALDLHQAVETADVAYGGTLGEATSRGGWVVDSVVADDRRSGFRAVLLAPLRDDNPTVLSFAGTGGSSLYGTYRDWVANVQQALGRVPLQYRQALETARAVQADHQDLVLAGHSLGGGLASYAGAALGLPAVGVNAAPLGAGTREHVAQHGPPTTEQRVTQYNVAGEIVSSLDGIVGWQPGLHCTVPGEPGLAGILTDHYLENIDTNSDPSCYLPDRAPTERAGQPGEYVDAFDLPGEVTYTRPYINDSDPHGAGTVFH